MQEERPIGSTEPPITPTNPQKTGNATLNTLINKWAIAFFKKLSGGYSKSTKKLTRIVDLSRDEKKSITSLFSKIWPKRASNTQNSFYGSKKENLHRDD
jgi:hypothetical protein